MNNCVLHVLCSIDERDGGPVRAVFDLSAEALPLGYSADILGFGSDVRVQSKFPLSRVHVLPGGRYPSLRDALALRKWLRANLHKYRGLILHGMWLWQLAVCAFEATQHHVPYACFPHGMLDFWPWRGQGFLKRIKKQVYWHLIEHHSFDNASQVFFTTHRELENAHQLVPIHPHQSLVLPYGVSFESERISLPCRNDLIKCEDEMWCLFLSRIHPKKNLEFLLRAWRMAVVPPNWKLMIAGTGDSDYLAKLGLLVLELDLTRSVRFTGHVSGGDKTYLFQNADLFLLPSNQENFGVAVLEAIHHGCPVLVSDEVYIAEFFHPDYPILSLDLDRWAKEITRILGDGGYRENLNRMNFDHLKLRFSISVVAREWGRTMENAFSNETTAKML